MGRSLHRRGRRRVAIWRAVRLSLQSMAKMDAINDRILRELMRDGRLSNLELADRVGLSPSACLRRVQDLERSGVIRGYRAVLDPVQMGVGFTAYVAVGLSNHTKAGQEAFERAIARAPQVRECHNVTGSVEYLLRVEAADLAAYKHFHTEILGILPGVVAITTYVVMGSPKDDRA
jgi:DNA-binding Lrp family transcriptional regulator